MGIVAAWLVLAVELAVVVLFGQRWFASIWEIQHGTLSLMPVALAVAAGCGALGASLRALVVRPERRPRVALALGLALSAGAVGWALGGGRLLASALRRGGFALALAVVAGLVTYALTPLVRRGLAARPGLLALGVTVVIVLLELVNAHVLVRLYPAFHLALALGCLLLAPLVVSASPRPWVRVLVLLSSVLALALSPYGARRLAPFDNFRMVLLERAPLGGQLVLLASRLSPAKPLALECEGEACLELDPDRRPEVELGPRHLDLRGRDLLLISVDALRADHLGTYGYGRPTTPRIDELARGGQGYAGVVFDYAYCPTPHTSYSITSLMTGKYIRPLLSQGVGEDSDTWASLLRGYGYRTAAFYPPALFFIDGDRFKRFREEKLGFEYVKEEFLEGEPRVMQVERYLEEQRPDQRVFVWVHLFGPHEPYQAHPGLGFGERDIDRYDSEIAAADRTVGRLVEVMRRRRPGAAVIITADHGEEFGEHGGRYHGTTVYEEQVRVPLVLSLPEASLPAAQAEPPWRVSEVVQTIDLLPTTLRALDIPIPPRVRGRDLSPVFGVDSVGVGFALAETDSQTLVAEGDERLICERRLGACQLFDLKRDPGQRAPVDRPARRLALTQKLQRLGESHGRFERSGRREEGQGWPPALLRGMSGDGEAAGEIAGLLDDADVEIRRKAAEVLFELRRPEAAQALELALRRDEDTLVRRRAALALTRLGRGAPLTLELLRGDDRELSRLAALALAETGDRRGEAVLVAWWRTGDAVPHTRRLELLSALGLIKSQDAVWPLVLELKDVRLRPHIAAALAQIGEEVAKVPLAKALAVERYHSVRVQLVEALVTLGADVELVPALTRFLGVPDPLEGGVGIAQRARILDRLGGPTPRELVKLTAQSHLGFGYLSVIPKGGNGKGVRVLVRAQSREGGQVYIAREQQLVRYDRKGEPKGVQDVPRLDRERMTVLEVPAGSEPAEVWARLSDDVGAAPGRPIRLVVFAERQVQVLGLALVPLADELPPPPPEPWEPGADAGTPGPDASGGADASGP
ncbi:MAG: sulfatase-like hydrolase/transferase [Polyangiaceae bacterium]|nr:sulfatase-like hydrolase/transferase [Polyangiaceae bacterium]MCW5791412.1 sulfatase-like hydrolase/transferase [Polyangiaceae bacterium]